MKRLLPFLYITGLILCVAGFILYATNWHLSPYFVTIGATLITLAQINDPYPGGNINIKRLRRQQTFGSLFLIAARAAMLYSRGNEWIVLVAIATVIYLYTSLRIPQEEKKNK